MEASGRKWVSFNMGLVASPNIMDGCLHSHNRFHLVLDVEKLLKPVALTFFAFFGIVFLLVHLHILFAGPENIFCQKIVFFDKIEHLAAGFILSGFFMSVVNHEKAGLISFVSVLFLGLIFELLETQYPFGGEPFDTLLDVCCNLIGAFCAIMAFLKLRISE